MTSPATPLPAPAPDPSSASPPAPAVSPVAPTSGGPSTDTFKSPQTPYRMDGVLPFPEMLARRRLIQNVLGQNVTLDNLGYTATHGYNTAQVAAMEASVGGVSTRDVSRMPGTRGDALEGARLIARGAIENFFRTHLAEEQQGTSTGAIGILQRHRIRSQASAMTEEYRARQTLTATGGTPSPASLAILSAELFERASGVENVQRKRSHHFNTAHFEHVLSTFTWEGAAPLTGTPAPHVAHNFLERVQSLLDASKIGFGDPVYSMLLQRLVVDAEARNAFIHLHSHDPNADREHVHHDMETNDKRIEHIKAISDGLKDLRMHRQEEIHLRDLLDRRLIQDRVDKHDEYVGLIDEMAEEFKKFRTAQLLRNSTRGRIGLLTFPKRRHSLQDQVSKAEGQMNDARLKIVAAAGKLQPLQPFSIPRPIGGTSQYNPQFSISRLNVLPPNFATDLTSDPAPPTVRSATPTDADFLAAMSALQTDIKGLNTDFTNELGGVAGTDLRTSTVAVKKKLDECRNTIRETELKMRNAAGELAPSNIQFNYDVTAPVAGTVFPLRTPVNFVNYLLTYHTPIGTPPRFPTPTILPPPPPPPPYLNVNPPEPSDHAILNAFTALRAQETALKTRGTDLKAQYDRLGTEEVKPLPRMSSDQLFYMMMRERLKGDFTIGGLRLPRQAENDIPQLAALATNMARVQAGTNIQEEININRAQQLLRERIPVLGRIPYLDRRSRLLGRVPRPWDPKETLGVQMFIKKISTLKQYEDFVRLLDDFPKRPITSRDILGLNLSADYLAKALGALDEVINNKTIDLDNRDIMHLLNLRTAMADAIQMHDAQMFTDAFQETKMTLPADMQELKGNEFILRLLEYQQKCRKSSDGIIENELKDASDGMLFRIFKKGHTFMKKRAEVLKLQREAKAAGKSKEEIRAIGSNLGFAETLTAGLALNEIGEAIMHRRRMKKAAKAAASASANATAGEVTAPDGESDAISEAESISHSDSRLGKVGRVALGAGSMVVGVPWAIGRTWKKIYIDTPRAIWGRIRGGRDRAHSDRRPKVSRRFLAKTTAKSLNLADTGVHVAKKTVLSPFMIAWKALNFVPKLGANKDQKARYDTKSFFGWLMERDALKKRTAVRNAAARGKPASQKTSSSTGNSKKNKPASTPPTPPNH